LRRAIAHRLTRSITRMAGIADVGLTQTDRPAHCLRQSRIRPFSRCLAMPRHGALAGPAATAIEASMAAAQAVSGAGPQDLEKIMNRSTDTGLRTPRLLLRVGGVALLAVALAACGGKKERLRPDIAASKVTTIGVNSYLWRASLDALSFMPLLQTDSNGGVIVTDWYTNPSNPGERVKVTVTILDQDLRADALRVATSRQVSQGGNWVDAPVQAATVQKLEDIILTKARDLRRSAIGG
jgi:hypothetical protein